jgi:hypothetical protein
MSWKKWTAALLFAFTGKNAAAAVTAAAVAGVTADGLGFNPVLWALGAFGASGVYAYRKPATRSHALFNGGVSVLMGGMVAPWAAAALGHYTDPVLGNEYVMALALSCAWPWLVPAAFGLYEKFAGSAVK